MEKQSAASTSASIWPAAGELIDRTFAVRREEADPAVSEPPEIHREPDSADAWHQMIPETGDRDGPGDRGIGLAKDMRAATARGEELGLSEDELAFYDALETNDSSVKVLGEPTLRTIARELVAAVRKNVTINWTLRENLRAQMRVLVMRDLSPVRLSV